MSVIARCIDTDSRYMDSPAGEAGYRHLVKAYRRIGRENIELASAYDQGVPAPRHRPVVDAFWWGVVRWSWGVGKDILERDQVFFGEWQRVFVDPHMAFAQWLRPLSWKQEYARIRGHHHGYWRAGPAAMGQLHNAAWSRDVLLLTLRWGVWRHLGELPAIWDLLRLVSSLDRWPGAVPIAYARSDLRWWREILGHFEWSPRMRARLDYWLAESAEQIAAAELGIEESATGTG